MTDPLVAAAGENFPVAARFLPAAVRRDLLALYGYCRLVDDLGDEAAGDRGALLDEAERQLDLVYAGEPEHPLFVELRHCVRAHDVPKAPLLDLIEANRMDQRKRRYTDFAELAGYCRLSANPVGRVVLHIFDSVTEENIRLSDQVCTALQLLEHLQDVAEDLGQDRIYLPRQDMERFGCTESDLATTRTPPAVRAVVRFETDRAVELLNAGAALPGRLRGTARIAVAGFVAGGMATATALRRNDFDVLARQIRPARTSTLTQWARLLVRSRS